MTITTVFLGSPAFAVPCLEALARDDQINLRLVITQPDRPAGRGRKLTSPPVKLAADDFGLQVIQPDTVKSPKTLNALNAEIPELLVVVAYGELLPDNVLTSAVHGAINVHPSLLPKYRGSTPIQASILNGDHETGVSIIQLTKRMDAGPVLARYPVAIELSDTTGSLSERLADIASDHIGDVCKQWIAGAITAVDQDDRQASYTREWSRDNARLNWTSSALDLERLIRASHPWPVSWTMFNNQPFRVHSARIVASSLSAPPGTVQRVNQDIAVATGSGSIVLDEVQPAGKRKMPAFDWWNGLLVEAAVFDSD